VKKTLLGSYSDDICCAVLGIYEAFDGEVLGYFDEINVYSFAFGWTARIS
jgi:hypothetical protein